MSLNVFRKLSVLSVLALSTVLLSASAWASDTAKVSFNESIRKESKTVTESTLSGSSSETQTVTQTKWSINGELSLTDSTVKSINGDSDFKLAVGKFEFKGKLQDDPDYAPGKTSARLTLKSGNSSDKSRSILVTVQLKWDKNKLVAKAEAKGFYIKSIAAEEFADNFSGDIKAETTSVIEFAGQSAHITIPFDGKVNRKSGGGETGSGSVSGFAATVNIRGEGRKQ